MARHNKKHDRRRQAKPAQPPVRPKHPADPAKQKDYVRRIRIFLRQSGDKPMLHATLANKCRAQRHPASFQAAVDQLLKAGEIVTKRRGYVLCDRSDCFPAEVVRLTAGYGFVRDAEGVDHFVPGKFLLGAMPGDRVLARPIPPRHEGAPEAQVVSVLEETAQPRLSGTIIPTEDGLCLQPDGMRLCLRIDYRESVPYAVGDQVLCVLTSRGTRHADHRARVLFNFGSADRAGNCMAAKIAAMDIPTDFPEEVLHEAEKLEETGISAFDLEGRLDLRDAVILTIDGAHSKDLDDAISVEKHADGYTLGVHIADVSHYVRPGSPLDNEALRRGTSIYYGDRVIPMLPPALSNGICSLNGGEERLAFSALMELSGTGDLISAKFRKSVIRSAVRGVYSECNAVLSGSADETLLQKYAPVAETLRILDELTTKLERLRRLRGAPELESVETVPLLNEEGVCVGLTAVQRGRSESIVEACMLTANEAAARCAREAEIPLVYRVHEQPLPERIDILCEMLTRLGGKFPKTSDIRPADIQTLLDSCREETWFPVINSLTLRSMAKARYSEEPLGHFGLALADYAHFTSPIRRYADLAVHRILTDHLSGAGKDWMRRRYGVFAEKAALQASETEVRAVQIEREADDCYAAEYMQKHLGEVFPGVITGVTDFGLYVTLDNMAEGLLHIHDLPDGEYDIEDGWFIKDTRTRTTYRLGMPLNVTCARADVASGKIDLVLAE